MCPLLLVGLEKFGETKQNKTLNSIRNVCCISLYLYREREKESKQKRGGHVIFATQNGAAWWQTRIKNTHTHTTFQSFVCFLFFEKRLPKTKCKSINIKKKHNLCSCKVTLKYWWKNFKLGLAEGEKQNT